jgi:hypothetical protein
MTVLVAAFIEAKILPFMAVHARLCHGPIMNTFFSALVSNVFPEGSQQAFFPKGADAAMTKSYAEHPKSDNAPSLSMAQSVKDQGLACVLQLASSIDVAQISAAKLVMSLSSSYDDQVNLEHIAEAYQSTQRNVKLIDKHAVALEKVKAGPDGLSPESAQRVIALKHAQLLTEAKQFLTEKRSAIMTLWESVCQDVISEVTNALPAEWREWVIEVPDEKHIVKELLDANVLKNMSTGWSKADATWNAIQKADIEINANFKASRGALAKSMDTALDDLLTAVSCNFAYKAIYVKVKHSGSRGAAKQIIKDTKQKIDKIKGKLPQSVMAALNESWSMFKS